MKDDYFEKHTSVHDRLPFKDLYKNLGISKGNFRNNIRMHPGFMDESKEKSIVEVGGGTYKSAFQKQQF